MASDKKYKHFSQLFISGALHICIVKYLLQITQTVHNFLCLGEIADNKSCIALCVIWAS